jgi:hypothetical protein
VFKAMCLKQSSDAIDERSMIDDRRQFNLSFAIDDRRSAFVTDDRRSAFVTRRSAFVTIVDNLVTRLMIERQKANINT